MNIVYLKSGRRQPVQAEAPLYPRDVQQDIPAGWCVSCGQMLYDPRRQLCRRCKGGQEDGACM